MFRAVMRRFRAGAALSDERGAAAVEFAMTVVPFLGFVFAILHVALYHFALQSLDAATRTASRQVMTGAVQSQGLTADQFRTTLLCPALRIPLSCANIVVSITKVSSAPAAPNIAPFIRSSIPALVPVNLDSSKSTYCLGVSGDYLFIDVSYSFINIGAFIQSVFGDVVKNSVVLRSTNFIYNEPFQSATGSSQSC